MIWTVCILLGKSYDIRLRKREESIEKCIVMFDSIETQVDFSSRNIQDIIAGFAERSELKFLDDFNNSQSNASLYERWKKSLKTAAREDCLKNEDIQILISFGSVLGVTDSSGQKRNCRLHKEMMKNSLENAREDKKRKGKLVTALGFIGGLGMAVLLY